MEIIEKLEKIIKENKYNNAFMCILYNMSCNDNYSELNNEGKYKIMNLIYDIYMNDESNIDLGLFSDIIMENYEKALNGEITRENIYNYMEGVI